MKNIIICATQRCGSTMVIEDMRNTEVMGQPEEWFVPWTPTKTDVDWADAFRSVKHRASNPDGVYSIKVMANQLSPVEGCLATFMRTEKTGMYPIFAEAFHGCAWIKLTRRDVVAQAISRVMSRQTGINHATEKKSDLHFAGNLQRGYDTNYNQKTTYNFEQIMEEVQAIVLENLAWARFFETNTITAVELFYEDIGNDSGMGHLDAIAKSANIEKSFQRRPRKLVKLANERNNDWKTAFYSDAASRGFRISP